MKRCKLVRCFEVLLVVTVAAMGSLSAQEPAAPAGLTATASSFQPDQNNEPGKAVDGRDNTFWHSAWNPPAPLPQWITVDRGAAGPVACLTYLPRQSGGNGIITAYNVHVSTDGENFTKVVSGGKWPANAARKFANFPATGARYVRLEAVDAVGKFASAAEITLSATPILYQPNMVTVLSPAYCSDIKGDTTLSIAAPGLTSAVVKCWKQGAGFGADSTVGTLTLDAQGKGSIVFPANAYPHGPLSVRISGTNGRVQDTCYLQLYNNGGVSWNEDVPKDPPPGAAGMKLIFADDFSSPLSISTKDPQARYYDHKPGGGDFSSLPFAGCNSPNNPFAKVDSYLRIRASEKANSAGLISSLKENGSGITASLPCYFECRFIAQNATGTWPAFWIMTDYMTERLKHAEKHGPDELDIIEAYGGEGPGRPNSDGRYRITSHYWDQGEAGKAQKGVDNPISMHDLGGKSSWSDAFHTYGCKLTVTDTIYYCDNIEVGRHPTGAVTKQYPLFFLINLATGGGWPVDLSRYDGLADMYVKYVRVWGQDGGSNAKAAGTAPETAPDSSVDGVTLCWFDGKLKWGKVGTLHDGVESPWFKGATPPESSNAAGGTYKFRSETIPAGIISQWDGTASRGEFPIKAGDKLFVYVLLDPKDPPFEVLLQLRANNSYDHRAFWGTVNKVTHMEPPLVGPLPATGKWVRLEVDPSVLKVGAKTKR
jgi:hypothetical protein